MKASKPFKDTIQNYLNSEAAKDPLFAETLKKKNKNIDECVNYILTTVQKSGCHGFADEEIYGMAKHYYDEDDIKNIKPVKGQVVVNHQVKAPEPYKMTSKEIEIAKADAYNEFIEEEKESIRKKNQRKKVKKEITVMTVNKDLPQVAAHFKSFEIKSMNTQKAIDVFNQGGCQIATLL